MKYDFWEYMEHNWILLSILLAVLVLAVCFWNLYRRQKHRSRKLLEDVAEERNFYRDFSETEESCYLSVRSSDMKVLFVSSNFEQMTGVSQESLCADLDVVRELIDGSRLRRLSSDLKNWNHETSYLTELPYHKKNDSSQKMAELLIHPQNQDGHYLIGIRDITEAYRKRLQLEEELESARKESQQKTDFLSQMSHEIRTPMNGIQGMLSLAKAHIEDAEATENYLIKAENLSQFLLQLINDILDMSRIESGKMQLAQESFDLIAMGERLDNMFRQTAESKGIHWSVRMQDFTVRHVIGDEMRLSQVIINFISNANKFTPSGGSVDVTFRQMDILEHQLHLMIRVRDTGKGIREDFIEKIFRPFEQEDASTARNYGGSGLGMAIADNMVRLMNGQILVDSQEGKGSEFTVYLTLPIAQEEEAEAAMQQKSELAAQKRQDAALLEDFTLENIHILLAEDNDINAEIAMEMLELQGAIVERACDGAEAVQKFAASAPGTYDVILMDIQMPNLDGWEATTQIRSMERPDASLPIFAMSANAFIEDQRHSLSVGMNGHINKPVNFEEVRKLIGMHIIRSH